MTRTTLPLLTLLAAGAHGQVATPPAAKPWIAMADFQAVREAEISNAGALEGTFERRRSGVELIHEGANHALDLEFYRYENRMTGTLASDPVRAYGDTEDVILSGFWQTARGKDSHIQFIGALELAGETEVDSEDSLRWGLGGAYRWKPSAEWNVALGMMVQSRFEMSALPIPYARIYWDPSPSVRVELRGTGLQNGIYARWFATADKATSVDLACAYETLTFRLTEGLDGPRAVAIGEVPIRIGVTQFLEPSGTWFVRAAYAYNVFHRESFRRNGESLGAFETAGTAVFSLRAGARF
jgi:hypothetical protein